MNKVSKEKKSALKNPKTSENLQMKKIKIIIGKLFEIHNDIKKVMEYSNRPYFETALDVKTKIFKCPYK